jgi:glycosyltransferase involved in cell wall biosynthesis
VKFSVLLPTRNRLELLSYALESVRRQNYHDWEVIVSDNDSSEDVCGYINGFGDPRIKYYRTKSFIPVTDNWTQALDKSNGDYVIMLGDDDSLMPDYFSRLKEMIELYEQPDFIYTSAYLYAYPGVLPNYPEGSLRSYERCPIFQGFGKPFWLELAYAKHLARMSLEFKIRFDYNMQFSLVSRKLIRALAAKGSFYQSPYPDYYASNAMMLEAKRILVVPENLIAIGISPKSFGFFYFNDAEKQGNAFLKNISDPAIAAKLEGVLLPGTDMNTSWLVSMETLARNFGEQHKITVNYSRYRLLQIIATHIMVVLAKPDSAGELTKLRSLLNLGEWLRYGVPFSILLILASLMPKSAQRFITRILSRLAGSHPKNEYPTTPGKFKNILEVFDFVGAKKKSM